MHVAIVPASTERRPNVTTSARLERRRWSVERANAWLPKNKLLGLRYDRKGFILEALLHTACLCLVVPRLARGL